MLHRLPLVSGYDHAAVTSIEHSRPTVAAFYLPQFHPIPENDSFWGPGFTEWRNVVQARPLWAGHHQPRLPADLGFYDLRCVDTQVEQAELALANGIGAFCYYHYWFNGTPVLDRPLHQMLHEPAVRIPFMLCWANENWTRRWDGLDSDVLLEQHYTTEDDRRHIAWMLPFLADDRYVRVDDKPVLLVYRVRLLPDPKRTINVWREEVQRHGIEDLHVCAVESLGSERGDPTDIGCDAAVEFQPDWLSLSHPLGRTRRRRIARRLGRSSPWLDNDVYSYPALASRMVSRPEPPYLRYACVTPQWDNSARRRNGATVLTGATPDRYAAWLHSRLVDSEADGRSLVFVNAWNEWAEGAYLEPDLRNGHAYLDATNAAIARLPSADEVDAASTSLDEASER